MAKKPRKKKKEEYLKRGPKFKEETDKKADRHLTINKTTNAILMLAKTFGFKSGSDMVDKLVGKYFIELAVKKPSVIPEAFSLDELKDDLK